MVGLRAEPVPDDCTAPAAANGAPHAHPRDKGQLYCADDVHILVVDDDPAVCRVIEAALDQQGFIVASVSEADQIEAQLQQLAYHVIVLDYVIPGVQAEQVLEWVHRDQPDASIIVVTAFPSVDSALQCLRARTYDYLTKPFQIAQLQRVVSRCLQSKGLLRLSEAALREALGAVVRERRKALGLTLAQVAQKTGVSLGYLSQIELGKNSASIETLYRISLGLGIRMADLFQGIQPEL